MRKILLCNFCHRSHRRTTPRVVCLAHADDGTHAPTQAPYTGMPTYRLRPGRPRTRAAKPPLTPEAAASATGTGRAGGACPAPRTLLLLFAGVVLSRVGSFVWRRVYGMTGCNDPATRELLFFFERDVAVRRPVGAGVRPSPAPAV